MPLKVVPGDNTELAVTLHTDIALEIGSRFTLREGGKTSKFAFELLRYLAK
jgi:translation elongation factor EF-Tu-like GTPase